MYSTGFNSVWPDETATTAYRTEISLDNLQELVNRKWPEATPDQISIKTENIRTRPGCECCYNPADYTDFLVITFEG